MANVQKQFETFHDTIRLDYKLDKNLRDKRDKVLKRVRKKLADAENPGFRELHQGSYKLRTGTNPVGTIEYDIDVGLRFDIDSKDHSSKDAREWVLNAAQGQTRVGSKGSCIRVDYAENCHVDLVVYACHRDAAGHETLKLASKTDGWRPADPLGLEEYIKQTRQPFAETEDAKTSTDQFRRVVRYLKRWYDEAIRKDSKDKPSGLAYTLLVAQNCVPQFDFEGNLCDLQALRTIAALGNSAGRLVVYKPTPEHEDLFAGLSDAAMDKFKERLQDLEAALIDAQSAADPVEACEILEKRFGSDFPIPDPEDTGTKTKKAAVVPSTASA